MASVPNDKDWYSYISDIDSTTYNMLVAKWWGDQTGSGFTAFSADHPAFVKSKRHQPRYIIAQDITTTKRKIKLPCGDIGATFYAKGQTFSWLPRGSATAVTMTVLKTVGEKSPAASSVASKPDYP